MSATDYQENASLKWALTANAVTRPTAWYVALFLTDPTDTGVAGTEVSGGSYARQSASFTVTGNVASNSGNVLFPTATANWGTIAYVAIYDAVSGGNMLYSGAASSSKLIETGDAYLIGTGNLTVTAD